MEKPTREQIMSYGHTIVTGLYANITMSLVVAGIQCFMSFYILSVFLETPRDSRRGRRPYVILSFLIFGVFSLSASLDAYHIFLRLSQTSNWLEMLTALQRDTDNATWSRILPAVLITVWIALGDGLLLYRCYILWSHSLWVLILPVLTYLATIGTGISLDVVSSTKTFDDANVGVANTLLATGTNVIITSLILFRLVQSRRTLGKVLPNSSSNVPYMGIMSILIESALPLAFFGMLHAIPALVGARRLGIEALRTLNGISSITSFFFYAFAALSPQMIIFKVTTGKSWTNQSEATQGVLTKSINFAHTTHDSHSDAESQLSPPQHNDEEKQ